MVVDARVGDRDRGPSLRNEGCQLFDDVIGSKHLGPDGQTGLVCKLFWRTTLDGPAKFLVNLEANDFAKAKFLFNDQNVIRRLG